MVYALSGFRGPHEGDTFAAPRLYPVMIGTKDHETTRR